MPMALRDKLNSLAAEAASKANTAIENGKLSLKINNEEKKIDEFTLNIGELVLDKLDGGETFDDEIMALYSSIQAAREVIARARADIEASRQGEEAEEDALSPTCSSCGAALSQEDNFCAHCGVKVEKAPAAVCPACGAVLSAEAVFCSQCGSKLAALAAGRGAQVQDPHPRPDAQQRCGRGRGRLLRVKHARMVVWVASGFEGSLFDHEARLAERRWPEREVGLLGKHLRRRAQSRNRHPAGCVLGGCRVQRLVPPAQQRPLPALKIFRRHERSSHV